MRDFAEDNPDVVGQRRCGSPTCSATTVTTVFSRMLRMPAVPEVFGYDPRLQFVHEDDVTAALEFADRHDVPGHVQRGGSGHDHVGRGVPRGRRAAGSPCRRC